MFGDIYDEDGRLLQQGENVLRAIHCCSDWDILGVMEIGMVDIVHYDALQYGSGLLLGKPDILRAYLDRGGMIAWGGIPQTYGLLTDLANRITDKPFTIRSEADYQMVAEFLDENKQMLYNLIKYNYDQWVKIVAEEAKYTTKQLARQTFIGATCGYGLNKSPELRSVSYNISRLVADGIKATYS